MTRLNEWSKVEKVSGFNSQLYIQRPGWKTKRSPVVGFGARFTVNGTIFSVHEDGSTHVLGEHQSKHLLSMDVRSYAETVERSHRYQPAELGGEVSVKGRLNARQYMIEQLKKFEKTCRLFVFTSQGVDHFRVVVRDDDLTVNDELADLYWETFDRYPDYDFRIEPIPSDYFDDSSVPSSAEEIPLGR